MARPLRIEFAGTLYHVTSRGDGRDDIFLYDEDRELWLDVLGHVCERFNWIVHAYCRTTAGMTVTPNWLETDWILAAFAKRKQEAQSAYRRFVADGKNQLLRFRILPCSMTRS